MGKSDDEIQLHYDIQYKIQNSSCALNDTTYTLSENPTFKKILKKVCPLSFILERKHTSEMRYNGHMISIKCGLCSARSGFEWICDAFGRNSLVQS